MKTIVLKLSGPMQSWGTSSNYEYRKTDYYPSKSGIIGLVAASLGLERDSSDIAKLNALDFAVRIDQPGVLKKDFQIAASYNENTGQFIRNYVIQREYVEDAVYLVTLGGEDNLISKVYDSLCNPYYQQYMGRKSCALPPDFVLGVYDGNSVDVLMSFEWKASEWYKKKNSVYIANIFFDAKVADRKTRIRNDNVVKFAIGKGLYEPRLESSVSVVLKEPLKEIEAMSAVTDFFDELEE